MLIDPKNIKVIQKKIAIVTCWYGPYPWYFPYFIHSCKFNPSVDFFIVTDNQQAIPGQPRNVKIVHKTLADIQATASQRLGFAVSIEHPYKLCDFKPTYGFLFPEIVKPYDFWGHADIDVIYGDIRGFITSDILNDYDVISSRHDYITGTFSLFRNTQQLNTLFMKSRDYKRVLSSPEHFCFDECAFLWDKLEGGESIFDYPDNIQSMTYVVKSAESKGKLKAFFDFIIIEGNTGNVMWHKGRVFYKGKYEAMFYHLIRFKTKCNKPRVYHPVPDTFCFGPASIYKKNSFR